MQVIPYQNEHLQLIHLQSAQSYFETIIDHAYAMQLEKHESFTVMVEGKIIACCGVVRPWTGRACAWALLAKDAGAHFVALHRAAKGYFDLCADRRIEALTDSDFLQGHRWLKMLGFRREGQMQYYTPDGRHVDLYARVKNV